LRINFETSQVAAEAKKIKIEDVDVQDMSHLPEGRRIYTAFCSLFILAFVFKARGFSLKKLLEVLDAFVALRDQGGHTWPEQRKKFAAIVAAADHLEAS
jgi:hypothetical protein